MVKLEPCKGPDLVSPGARCQAFGEPSPTALCPVPDISPVSRILHCLEKEAVGSEVLPVQWPQAPV